MKKALLAASMMVIIASPAFSQMRHMPMEEHAEGHGHMMEMCNMCDMDGMGMGHGMGEMMGKCLQLADKLGLSDEQVNKIKPIHREMQKKQVRFRADLQLARIDLMDIMEVKDFDWEKATAAIKKIGDMKTEHHLEMLKSMKEVRAILTDEQFKKMKKLMPMKMEGNKPPQKSMKKK